MSNTLKNINKKKLLELPVAEDMQMGMSLGLIIRMFQLVFILENFFFMQLIS